MGTLFKTIVITLAMVGLCFLVTTYKPGLWADGFTVPGIKVHMSYAAALVLSFLMLGFLKLQWAK
jgi:hypothetical protein